MKLFSILLFKAEQIYHIYNTPHEKDSSFNDPTSFASLQSFRQLLLVQGLGWTTLPSLFCRGHMEKK